jgi:hypothetical protein
MGFSNRDLGSFNTGGRRKPLEALANHRGALASSYVFSFAFDFPSSSLPFSPRTTPGKSLTQQTHFKPTR